MLTQAILGLAIACVGIYIACVLVFRTEIYSRIFVSSSSNDGFEIQFLDYSNRLVSELLEEDMTMFDEL